MKKVWKSLLFTFSLLLFTPAAQAELVEYRDYDADTMTFTNAVRECTLVTSGTRSLANGWYAVTGTVTIPDGITVNGSVHLILCDGATWAITNKADVATVSVGDGASLTIYGQTENTGRLDAKNGKSAAGIGGDKSGVCGTIAIHGGTVTAEGGTFSAGIGCGMLGIGGSVTITGGRICAIGHNNASDIGDAYGSTTHCKDSISGGVFARELKTDWLSLGYKAVANEDESTKAAYPWTVKRQPDVTVTVGEHPNMTAAYTFGDGTVTNAIKDADFELPYDTKDVKVIFTANEDYEIVGENVVNLGTVTADIVFGEESGHKVPQAVSNRAIVVFRDYDANTGTFTNAARKCTLVTSGTRTLTTGWWAVNGEVTIPAGERLVVEGTAHLVLCDGAKLNVVKAGDGLAAVKIEGAELTIYGQTAGSGQLVVAGGDDNKNWESGAGIGGDCNGVDGSVTINGGTVTATGGYTGAGIGGGTSGEGCTVTINGGTVTAQGGDYDSAGIGSAYDGTGGKVTITGGRIDARRGLAADSSEAIGNGGGARSPCEVAISGGVFALKPKCAWMTSGCQPAANTDPETKADYPYGVLRPSVTINEIKALEPWDGAKGVVTVDYSLANIDRDSLYKVAFDITADGQTASVTNNAAQLIEGRQAVLTNETVKLFGKETIDSKAKVRISLIVVTPPAGQLWKDGPIWAGGNERSQDNFQRACQISLYHAPWRLPTREEFEKLIDNAFCRGKWDDNLKGLTYTGLGVFSLNSIFLPAEGFALPNGVRPDEFLLCYWSSDASAFAFDGVSAAMKSSMGNISASVRGVRDATEADYESWMLTAAEAEFWPEVVVALTNGTGYGYVVSNQSDKVEIAPTETGGSTYFLPVGAEIGIYCVAEEDYDIVGTNPYVIDEVKFDTTIDTGKLPTAEVRPGTERCPWEIGEGVTAYVKDRVLYLLGEGEVDEFADGAPWAEYDDLLTGIGPLSRAITIPASVAATLPISVEGSGPSGAISGAEFEAVQIIDGKAYLDVSVYTSDTITNQNWSVATNGVIEVPAEGKQGFFYLMSKPAVPSNKPFVPPPLPIEQ